ncbi:bifunctional riboflavin kinase/FAD synthetase [Flavobacterium dankookense]|uniref:Riboflavin biosynthesis protein n=1 Tax=Flavobacterium dankookense TaxID=706186 RepID=A0A4R6Q9B8_9FLAO|nr:bifunctional riboflavin kinase/FAD synthetase [Flavobacterium dankookense]TDP58881.1 riboflavin kinase/FMN adenylyltransferase [Flavobacterium dankookense]
MKIYQSISDFFCNKKTIITIGTFDGVHIGHKKILEKITQHSNQNKFESIVLTFFPHPRIVLQTGLDMKQLNTINEKVSLIRNVGIDNLVIHPFDKVFSQLTAEDFVKKVLVDKFNIQKIIIGHDHRFGKNRTADINDLIAFGKKYNFEVEQITAEEIEEVAISSTKIRNALSEGNIKLANKYLGYNYTINGIVIKGNQLGRTIGFPTANIEIKEDYKLVPLNGVYIVQTLIDNEIVFGMMNIGTKPTVGGTSQSIEVHFFDFNDDIYDKTIEISFLERIRDEQKFESIELLKKQLSDDKLQSLKFISENF